MKASQLFDRCSVEGLREDVHIPDVSSDSRRIVPGDLFICLEGNSRDGHDFAREACKRGAGWILAMHPVEGVPREKLLLTSDTRRAEAYIRFNQAGRPTERMKTVAVTGTAGKTSIVFLLAHILRSAGKRVGMISTVKTLSHSRMLTLGEHGGSSVSDISGAMTTPDPEYFFGACADMERDGCEFLLYEASSRALQLHKLDPVENDLSIFTNLTREHLDCHGTMENYFAVKAGLMERSRRAIINLDDAYMRTLGELYPHVPVLGCSADASKAAVSDACALRIRAAEAGMEYVYFSEKAVFRVRLPQVGHYSVINSLEAAAAAMALGIEPMTVKKALESFDGVPGRMQRLSLDELYGKDLPAVYIDYAHTPASLASALASLRNRTEKRLVVLFGCGGDRDRTKRPHMGSEAQNQADYVILTSDNPRSEDPGTILSDILAGMDKSKPYTVIENRRDAIRYALEHFGAGDTVLLAGKGHEKYEITHDGIHPFDEEEEVRLAAVACRKADYKTQEAEKKEPLSRQDG